MANWRSICIAVTIALVASGCGGGLSAEALAERDELQEQVSELEAQVAGLQGELYAATSTTTTSTTEAPTTTTEPVLTGNTWGIMTVKDFGCDEIADSGYSDIPAMQVRVLDPTDRSLLAFLMDLDRKGTKAGDGCTFTYETNEPIPIRTSYIIESGGRGDLAVSHSEVVKHPAGNQLFILEFS